MIEAIMLPMPGGVVDGTTSVPGAGPAVLVKDGKGGIVFVVTGDVPAPPGESGLPSLPL